MTKAAQFDDVMTELDQDQVERAYDRWAPIYDLVFGAVAVFSKGYAARRFPRPIDTAAGCSRSGSEPGFPCPSIRPRFRSTDRHLGGDCCARRRNASTNCG